jgi:hypothetical protein
MLSELIAAYALLDGAPPPLPPSRAVVSRPARPAAYRVFVPRLVRPAPTYYYPSPASAFRRLRSSSCSGGVCR